MLYNRRVKAGCEQLIQGVSFELFSGGSSRTIGQNSGAISVFWLEGMESRPDFLVLVA